LRGGIWRIVKRACIRRGGVKAIFNLVRFYNQIEHLKKIFADSELQEDSVVRKFRITASDGKNYNSLHYKLPATIAVGDKVNSERRAVLQVDR
jgi:hypothetical protein